MADTISSSKLRALLNRLERAESTVSDVRKELGAALRSAETAPARTARRARTAVRRGRPPARRPAARKPSGKRGRPPLKPQDRAPFPGWTKVSASNQTETRRILATKNAAQLEAGLKFERSHDKRKGVIAMLQTALKKRKAADKAKARPAARPAAAAGNSRRAGRSTPRKGAPARRGRRGKTNTDKFIDYVAKHPGTTVAEAAPKLRIDKNVLYATAHQLGASGRVRKSGPKFYPAKGAARKTTAKAKPAAKRKPAARRKSAARR